MELYGSDSFNFESYLPTFLTTEIRKHFPTTHYKARPTKNAGLWSLFFLLFIVCFLFPITYLISANTDSLVALAEHSNRKGTMLTAQGCLKAISVDSTHPEDDPPLRSKLVSASTKISRFTL